MFLHFCSGDEALMRLNNSLFMIFPLHLTVTSKIKFILCLQKGKTKKKTIKHGKKGEKNILLKMEKKKKKIRFVLEK